MDYPFRHGSLFSGIGGFDLAAEWMGWNNVFHCEINTFCQKVLKYHFPNAATHTDIKQTDFSIYRGQCDIVSGGFPCQPYSVAGKRKGSEDDRHLWPEMLRAIREIQPSWIVGENVPGLLNWQRGMVLAEIKSDLESEGFEVLPPCILPSCGKNAIHKRYRLWIIAFNASNDEYKQKNKQNGNGISKSIEENIFQQKEHKHNGFNIVSQSEGIDTNTELRRCKESGRQPVSREYYNDFQSGWPRSEPLLCGGNDGIPNWVDRIKALGNSIVPQIAYEIFKAIEEYDKSQKTIKPFKTTREGPAHF